LVVGGWNELKRGDPKTAPAIEVLHTARAGENQWQPARQFTGQFARRKAGPEAMHLITLYLALKNAL
jgi:hypothetical protein